MSLAKWLQDRLGSPSPGRGCRHVKCLVCRADVLAGLDEDQAALAAIVDPVALSPYGEVEALIGGRKTYELRRQGQGLALWYRHHWHISRFPASDGVIVLASHKCGTAKLPSVEIKPLPGKVGLPHDAEPPF